MNMEIKTNSFKLFNLFFIMNMEIRTKSFKLFNLFFIMNMEIKTNSFKFFNLKFNSYGSFFWNMVASSHVKNVGFSLDRWTQTMVMMERRTDKTDLIRSCLFSYHFIYETTWAVLFKFIPTLSLCINSLPRKRHDQCRSFQFDNLYNNPQTLIQLSTVIVCHCYGHCYMLIYKCTDESVHFYRSL